MFTSIKKLLIFALSLLLFIVIASCSNLTSGSSSTTNATTQTDSTTTSQITEDTTTDSTTTNSTTTAEVSTTTTESSSTTTETTTILTTTTATETTTSSSTTTVITSQPTTTFTTTSTVAFVTSIEVVNIEKNTYEIGEDFLPDTIYVMANLTNGTQIRLRPDEYTYSGFDSTTVGETNVTIFYESFTTVITLNIIDNSGLVIDMVYYSSASGLSGNTLFLQLRNIINSGFAGVTYGEARYILDETDADPSNSNNVILVYLGTSVSGVWDGGITWNREHVWPQSLLPDSASNGSVNTASDLQNLKPSNPSENSSRGNKYFDNITTSVSYEPRDEVKGDIARILLYMMTMYSELNLVNREPNYLEMGLLNVLLSWHEADPVDDFERNRNEIIYSYQKNRNPFIDYPEFVDLIW